MAARRQNRYIAKMTERSINPLLKIALEMGPILVFFVTYAGSDIFTATAVFIPTILAALAVSWRLNRRLPRIALVTAVRSWSSAG